jgi:hypothetical protein
MAFTSQPGNIEPGLFHPGALESESSSVAVSGADTGAGVDAQTLAVTLNGTDTASGAEANSLSVTLNSADTASGAEAYTLTVQVSSSDSASGVDAESVSVAVSQGDTASGAEDQSLAVSESDTSSGLDEESLAVTLSDNDDGTSAEDQLVDDQSETSPDDADTGSASEDQSIASTLTSPDDDPLTIFETFSLEVAVSDSDTGSATDSESLAVSGADTGSGADAESHYETYIGTDTGTTTESESISVVLSDGDTIDAVDTHRPFPAGPVEIGDYQVSLVMGPATVYVADFETLEPLDSEIASVPAGDWMDIGTTLDGVVMTVKQEFEPVNVTQKPEAPARRLKRRHLEVDLSMAEPTLTNMLYALNSGELDSGSGYTSYSPPFLDRATPLTYRAVIIDGWAPGFSEVDGKHRRRRIILRKCLSIDDASLGYTKDKLTACNVKWTVHRVDGVTTPFKIIDEE